MSDDSDKRAEILARLRENLSEDRTGELGDVDGVRLLSRFLQRISEEPEDPLPESLSRTELSELRQFRRKKRREESAQDATEGLTPIDPVELDIDTDGIPLGAKGEDSILDAVRIRTLIDEIPRLRDNFSEWLTSIDAEYVPSSTSVEELERLRENSEYRLKALTVMVNATRQELDEIIVTIRAKQAIDGQAEEEE